MKKLLIRQCYLQAMPSKFKVTLMRSRRLATPAATMWEVKKGNSQYPPGLYQPASNKDTETQPFSNANYQQEEIKCSAGLNFCLITLWCSLLCKQLSGLWMVRLNRCFLLGCWHSHKRKMTWEDANFRLGLKLSWLMDQQQLQVSDNMYQSNQRVIYPWLKFRVGFLLNTQLNISLCSKLGWHKLAKKEQSIIESPLIKGFLTRLSSFYWHATFLFRKCWSGSEHQSTGALGAQHFWELSYNNNKKKWKHHHKLAAKLKQQPASAQSSSSSVQ